MNISRAVSDAWNKFRDLLSGEISRVGKAASDITREAGSTPARTAANTLESKDEGIGKTVAAAGKEENEQPQTAVPEEPTHHREPLEHVIDEKGGPRFDSPRSAFFDPEINKQIGDDLRARHGIEVYNFDMSGADTYTIREIGAAFDDILPKYPRLDILSIKIDGDLKIDRGFAEARESWLRNGDNLRAGTKMYFSAYYAKNPEALYKTVQEAVSRKHFFQGTELRPVYRTVVHEIGHAVAHAGRLPERGVEVERSIWDYYIQKYGHKDSFQRTQESYLNWLADGLSGYSFRSGRLNLEEAAPEAFVNVEVDGSRASEPAVVIHKIMLEKAEQAGWRCSVWDDIEEYPEDYLN